MPSKEANDRLRWAVFCQPAHNQPESQIMLHKIVSPRDFYLMTLHMAHYVLWDAFFFPFFSSFLFFLTDCKLFNSPAKQAKFYSSDVCANHSGSGILILFQNLNISIPNIFLKGTK